MNSGPVLPPTARWLLIVVPFLGFWLTGLTDVDEGFYGAIAANMIRSGDWIIPQYQGAPWFEKPVLVFWMAGAAIQLLGMELGPRLPSVLASLGTISLCMWFAKRHFSARAAEFVGLVLAGSILFVIVGQMLLADPFMVFGLSGAILYWLDFALLGNRNWLLSSICIGIALLAKGPVGVFLFAAVAFWTVRVDGHRYSLTRTPWLGFCLLAFATASIWYVPAFVRAPSEFWGQFIVEQNFYRFFGADLAHRAPAILNIPYYFLVLLVSFSPWWFFALKGRPKRNTALDSKQVCLQVFSRWAIVVLALFTLMGSKLPHYILPAIIPLSLIAGEALSRSGSGLQAHRVKWLLIAMPIVATIFANTAAQLNDSISGARESRALARIVRERAIPIVAYQIRTRNRDLSLKLKPQETSLPSLGLYFGREPIEVEIFDELFTRQSPYLIFSRSDRISPAEQAQLKARFGDILLLSSPNSKFALYEVRGPLTD